MTCLGFNQNGLSSEFICVELEKCRGDVPFTGKVFGDDGDESLQGSEDGSVDHDWAFELRRDIGSSVLVGTSVTKVESLGEVEVELKNTSALAEYR